MRCQQSLHRKVTIQSAQKDSRRQDTFSCTLRPAFMISDDTRLSTLVTHGWTWQDWPRSRILVGPLSFAAS